MARLTTRPCLERGCPELVIGAPRCPDHAAAHERARGTADQRGYDSEWRRIVRQAIALQPYCSICGTTDDLTGDHLRPLSRGGTNHPSNVRVLCRAHNSARGNRPLEG